MHVRWLNDLKAFAKTALLARSMRTAYLLHTRRLGQVAEVRVPGLPGRFRFRTGTSDAKFLRVLLDGRLPPEYELPPGFEPRVILDIGANVGGVTVALARKFPHARILAFEPLPENAELLVYNVSALSSVTACRYGLGARTEKMPYTRSDNPRNFGGGGFYGGGKPDPAASDTLPVVSVRQALEWLGVDRVDLIKIDTEGAEHDILTSFPPAVLAQVGVIVGELHGKPRDAELIEYLKRYFDVRLTLRRGKPKWFRATRSTEQRAPTVVSHATGVAPAMPDPVQPVSRIHAGLPGNRNRWG